MTKNTFAIEAVQHTSNKIMMLTANSVPRVKTRGAADVEDTRQSYIERVRNYIPVEVIAFFIFCNAMIAIGDKPARLFTTGATIDEYVAVAAVLISLIGVVVFVKIASEKAGSKLWKLHACISTLAFLVWIYAMGAKALIVIGIPQVPSLSGLLLATFTMFSGLIVPVTIAEDAE